MKAFCDVCGTEYEIDEAKVPQTGLAVKCVQCQNIFVVRKKEEKPAEIDPVSAEQVARPTGEMPEAPAEEPAPYWTLKRDDGSSYQFKDVATLQRWIVEHKAIKDDHVTRDGETWHRLDEMPELEPFFHVVEKAQSGVFPVVKHDEPEPRMTMQMWAVPQEEESKKTPTQEQISARTPETPPEAPTEVPETTPEIPEAATEAPVEATPEVPEAPIEQTPETPVEETPEAPKEEAQVVEKTTESFVRSTPAEGTKKPSVIVDLNKSSLPEDLQLSDSDAPTNDEKPAEEAPKTEESTQEKEDDGPSDWGSKAGSDFGTSDWDAWADDDSEFSNDKRILKPVLIVLVAIIAIAGIALGVSPDLRNKLFSGGPSQEILDQIQKTRIDINLNTKTSLQDAEDSLVKITEQLPEYSEAMAMLSEVYAARAEKASYTLEAAEKQQQELDKILLVKTAKLREKEDLALRKEAVSLQKQLNEANRLVTLSNDGFNSNVRKTGEYAKRSIELAPEAMHSHRALADWYRIGMNASMANEHIEKAEKINSEDAITIYIKGALFSMDEALLANALQSLKMAALKDPTLIRAKFKLAYIYASGKKYEDAKKILKEIIDQNPQHEASKKLLSHITKKEKPAEKVEKAPEKKEKKAAKSLSFSQLMSAAKRQRNADNAKGALNYYKKAVKLQQNSTVYSGMGFCYFDLGNFQGALDNFRKALRKNSASQGALIGIAMTYDQMGNNSQAAKYYQKYLDKYPSGEDAPAARNALKKLQ